MQEQRKDPTLKTAWEAAHNGEQGYVIEDDLLYRLYTRQEEASAKRLIPKKRRAKLLALSHGSPLAPHLGRRRTTTKLAKRLFWPGMTSEVRQLVRECEECQKCNQS